MRLTLFLFLSCEVLVMNHEAAAQEVQRQRATVTPLKSQLEEIIKSN
jgi:hypothetical protein